jgi:hypothetical protein
MTQGGAEGKPNSDWDRLRIRWRETIDVVIENRSGADIGP